MSSNVQQSLSKNLDRAADALRQGVNVARHHELDIETGLRTRASLYADLARLNGIPARLELLALNAGDGLDDVLLTSADTELPRRIGEALRGATEPRGARAYRLDGSLYAFLGPIEIGALTPAAAAHAALGGSPSGSPPARSAARRGSPTRPLPAPEALAIAHERLRARSRWQRCRPSVRFVTSCCRSSPSAAPAGRRSRCRASPPTRSASGAGSASRSSELDDIVRAAELQDIGMLAVPRPCCTSAPPSSPRSGRRSAATRWSASASSPPRPRSTPVARLVRSSYERYDGTGYPDGIRGERIPLGSRIIAVCVAYDAMTSPRPYREALPAATAFEELCRCAGRQFDPMVVAAFCAEMNQLDPEAATATA